MRVTYKGDYALKAILDLAVHYDHELVTSHDLAQRIDAPIKFLEQVLLELKKGGFIESRRGKTGGYLLSRPPAQITVGDVLRFIDGPLEPIACVREGYMNCGDSPKCVFRPIWQQVDHAISQVVDNINFADLAQKADHRQQALAYYI